MEKAVESVGVESVPGGINPPGALSVKPGSVSPPIDDKCVWVATMQYGWQEGEQGVIEACAAHLEAHIPPDERVCVEFGAGDGDGLPLTVMPVAECDGWRSLLIEPNRQYFRRLSARVPESAKVVQACVTIDGENSIDSILDRCGFTPNPAVMVVDVDSIEYHVVEQMRSRPAILCVETLDRMSPMQDDVPFVPKVEACGTIVEDGFDTQLQANGAAFDVLLGGRGYSLVYRTRYNSIYVRGDMIPHLRKDMLNLGCGDRNFPGYEPVDVRVNGKDVRKLEHADLSQDEVMASHVLEHLPYSDMLDVMSEWTRVLKPGGVLRIAVPDMRKIGAELAKPDLDDGQVQYLAAMLYGSQNYKENFHQWGYTEQTLSRAMYAAGIGNIRTWQPFNDDCSSNPFSLNLSGTKRWWPRVERPRITLVMSQPEIAHTGHEMALMEMVKELTKRGVDIDFMPPRGAFWDRDMTIGTVAAIHKYNPHFLLYSDYDGQFDASDIMTLLDSINGDPTMAAIGGVQMSRHDDLPLVMDANVDYSGDISRVRFSHFGLMLVRRQVFDEMPQPWFVSVPGKGADGEWDWTGWGRSDADITFWRTMDMMGFRVYQHNRVVVGHNIRAIKYPSLDGKGVTLWPIENLRRHGKPKRVGFNPELFRDRLNRKNGVTSPPKKESNETLSPRGGTEDAPAPQCSRMTPKQDAHRNGSL